MKGKERFCHLPVQEIEANRGPQFRRQSSADRMDILALQHQIAELPGDLPFRDWQQRGPEVEFVDQFLVARTTKRPWEKLLAARERTLGLH